MNGIYAFLRAFREYLVVFALASCSIFLIVHSDGPPVAVLRTYALAIFGSFQSSMSWITSGMRARSDLESLREVNMGLMEEVLQLRRFRHENEELRALLTFRRSSPLSLVPAEVIGKNIDVGQSTITIDAGTDDSVRIHMAVINEHGLVGRITATSAHYAVVQLAVNRGFRASAKVRRSLVDGIAGWQDGDRLALLNIWKTADVVIGDTVVTSAYSNIFPPDIPIGTVSRIGPGEGGLFHRVDIRPFVTFETLEHVFVIRHLGDPERERLESLQDDASGEAP